MKILKIIFLVILVAVMSGAGYIYLNRKTIFDYNINKLTKSLLPDYIEIKDLNFDLQNKKITVKDFKIKNPPGFINDYLIEIPKIECVYTQIDNTNILRGVSIKDIDLIDPAIYIVRQDDSSVNVQKMDEVAKASGGKMKKPTIGSKVLAYLSYLFSPVKRIEDLIKIEPVLNITNGKFVFDDFSFSEKGYKTTIEDIAADVDLTLRKDLKGIDYIKSKGSGFVNGGKSQALSWITEYNPTRPKLTMANTFDITGVDFIHFKPYYDKFSPFIFKSGAVSGELVFNFDNAEIGSTNEVRFSGLELEPKKDFNYSDIWEVSTDDLYKYFSSPGGEIVFDFKIKGPMERPKFYLGSKTKRALTRMLMYKMTDALLKKDTGQQSDSQAAPSAATQGEKSEVEQVIDIFKTIKNSYDSRK